MIELPIEFKQNIINRYKKIGIKWLNSVHRIIEKYVKKFNLYNVKLVKELTMNVVLFASSDEYGEVVIKICSPSPTSFNEIKYMKLCSSKYFAKCYYFNIKDRVMILENIYPGYQLNHIKNQEERINIFCDMLNNIVTDDISKSTFPSYEKKLKETIKLVNNNKQKYSNILYMLDIISDSYNEIKNVNMPKYVLHNDLQHKNILKSNDGWKLIDPHGVIGEKIFETTQFIRAELEYTNVDEIDKIVTLISKNLKEDKILIYKALYINIFSKVVFYIKNKYDKNVISYNIKVCEKISKYIEVTT